MRWWILEHLENCKKTHGEEVITFNGPSPIQLLFWGWG